MLQRVILRVDGNTKIGLGHIYRCLALAETLREYFSCEFAIADPDVHVFRIVESAGFKLIALPSIPYQLPDEMDGRNEIKFDIEHLLQKDDIVLLDGYWFGSSYERSIKEMGCKLVCIDDLANHYFYADVIINHSPGFDPSIYRSEYYTKIYTGLEYSLIRPDFYKRPFPERRLNDGILIFLGGVDHYNLTHRIAKIICEINHEAELRIIVSSSFHKDNFESLLSLQLVNPGIQIFKDLGSNEMLDIMDHCKYAVVSASTVLIEAYARKLYSATGYYSSNQKFIYNSMVASNQAFGIGDFLKVTDSELEYKLKAYFLRPKELGKKKVVDLGTNLLNVFKDLCQSYI